MVKRTQDFQAISYAKIAVVENAKFGPFRVLINYGFETTKDGKNIGL